jgi:hypothetical protein
MISAAQLEGEMVDLGLEAGLVGASILKEATHYLCKFCNTYLFVVVENTYVPLQRVDHYHI